MFHTEIISDIEELGDYRTQWNQLLLQSKNNIFLTWEWISTWWEFFGKNSLLFVVVVKNADGRLIGVAPLKISSQRILGLIPVRSLEFIGSGSPVSPEYLDFIVPTPNREEIVTEMVSILMKNKRSWDVLNLSDVDESSLVLPLLRRLFSEKNVLVRESGFNVCPYLGLPSRWGELLSSYSHNMRRTVKVTRKRLEESFSVRLVLVEDAASLPEAFGQAARLHELSRQKKGERGSFRKKDYSAFHLRLSQAIAERGWLYLAFLEVDQCPAAFRYGYLYDRKYYDYQTGYDPRFAGNRVGWVMLGYIMEDLIKRSTREFDFLRGGHEYKWHWTKEFRRTQSFCCFQYSLRGLPLFLWRRAKEEIKSSFLPRNSEVPHEEN
ncbi:MAG: GNAT family N-acetyltransferase [Candidatus Eisenbacteria bacterium]